MRLGICTDSTNVGVVERLGYDFIELGVAELAPEQPDSDFVSVRERILSSGLRAEALNRFIPRGLMLVGPDVDSDRARRYVEVALARAGEIGSKIVVWGSPHARNVPEGFPRERAFEELVEIGRFMGEQAALHGQTIVVEPLDRQTTNTIWTVADGYDLARRIEHSSVKTMADIYQMAKNDEPLAGMEVAGSFLCHVHLSDPDRMPPSNPENFDFYREAFGVLKQMGYQGRASIEARITDFETQARRGLEVVKQLWAD